VDLAVLEQILVRFSYLVIEQPWIKEMDINPLFASSHQLTALDARIVLHDPSIPQEQLPKPVIRPYPSQYITPWKLKDGSSAVIRPIRPEDEPLLVRFHETLSEQSVRLRYLHSIHLSQRISHERLARVCFNDYDREIALVIEQKTATRRRGVILAVGRLSRLHGSKTAKFALVVGDRWQGNGLGMRLMKSLLHVAREEKLERLMADIPPESHEMRKICKRLNFGLAHEKGDSVIKAEIRL
jgi:acetyltransferase